VRIQTQETETQTDIVVTDVIYQDHHVMLFTDTDVEVQLDQGELALIKAKMDPVADYEQGLVEDLVEEFLDNKKVKEHVDNLVYGYGIFTRGQPMTEAQEDMFCQLQVQAYHRLLAKMIAQL
jgi:hypothetical protein